MPNINLTTIIFWFHSDNIIKSLNINIKFIELIIDEELSPENYYLKKLPELSFFCISQCDIIICANSTFSLWASYFSKSEKIYIPNKWFGTHFFKNNVFDINELILNDRYEIIKINKNVN